MTAFYTKKALSTALIATIGLSLTACGSGSDHEPSANNLIKEGLNILGEVSNEPLVQQTTESMLPAEPEAQLAATTQQTGKDEFVFAGTMGKLAYHNYLSSEKSPNPKTYLANFAICSDSDCQKNGNGIKTGQLEFKISVADKPDNFKLTDIKITQANKANVNLNHYGKSTPYNPVLIQNLVTNIDSNKATLTLTDKKRRLFTLNIEDEQNNISIKDLKIAFSQGGAWFTGISDDVALAGARKDNNQPNNIQSNPVSVWQNAQNQPVTAIRYDNKWLGQLGTFNFDLPNHEDRSNLLQGFNLSKNGKTYHGAYANIDSNAFVYGYAIRSDENITGEDNYVKKQSAVVVVDPTAQFATAINFGDSLIGEQIPASNQLFWHNK